MTFFVVFILTCKVNRILGLKKCRPHTWMTENQRLPHMMHEIFMRRVDEGTTTHFAAKIYQVVQDIEREIDDCSGRDTSFESPLTQVKLSSWEDYAHRMKRSSLLDSKIQLLYTVLEVWYVALRMIVQSWEEEEQLVLQWLIINNGLQTHGCFGHCLKRS